MPLPVLALVAVGLTARAAPAQTPSFECTHAATAAERAVCASPALSSLDSRLANAYKAALANPDADARVVREEQLTWLHDRDRRCRATDAARAATDTALQSCLQDAYDHRLAQLTVSVEDGGCDAVALALRAAANTPFPAEGRLAEVAAGTPGSSLRLDEQAGGGYALESTIAGSGHCQNEVQLQRAGAPGIPGPASQEGGYCGEDRIRLASINGIVGVLGELVRPEGSRPHVLSVSLRKGTGWTRSCSLRVTLTTSYRVAVASCRDGGCGALPDLVRQYTEAHHEQPASTLPSPAQLSTYQQAAYGQMLRLAEAEGLTAASELPYFGSKESAARLAAESHCQLSFDGAGSRLFPVVSGRELLLGRIGTDGVALGLMSGGPNDAVAIYRPVSGRLLPAAGFCVVAVDQTIAEIVPWSGATAAVRAGAAPGRAPHEPGATAILFDNQSRGPVDVLWQDSQGDEHLYQTLQPGQRYLQSTYVAHRWVVRNAVTHDVMDSAVAVEQQQTLVVSDRH